LTNASPQDRLAVTKATVLYCVKSSGITDGGPGERTASLGKLNA